MAATVPTSTAGTFRIASHDRMARAVLSRLAGHGALTLTVSADAKHPEVTHACAKVAAGKRPSVEMTFSLDHATRTAHIGNLEIARSLQGRGIGRDIVGTLADLLGEAGFHTIEVLAGFRAGGYAWAALGFLPSPRGWSSLRSMICDTCRIDGLPTVTDGEARAIAGIMSSPDPASIRGILKLDRPTETEGTLGKDLLCGTMWRGTLDLADGASLAVLSAGRSDGLKAAA